MIFTTVITIIFSVLFLVDKLVVNFPLVAPGLQFLNQLLLYVDNLVYMVRLVMPLTVSMFFILLVLYFLLLFSSFSFD